MKNYNESMGIALRFAKGETINTQDIGNIKDVGFCLRELKNNCNNVLRQIAKTLKG